MISLRATFVLMAVTCLITFGVLWAQNDRSGLQPFTTAPAEAEIEWQVFHDFEGIHADPSVAPAVVAVLTEYGIAKLDDLNKGMILDDADPYATWEPDSKILTRIENNVEIGSPGMYFSFEWVHPVDVESAPPGYYERKMQQLEQWVKTHAGEQCKVSWYLHKHRGGGQNRPPNDFELVLPLVEKKGGADIEAWNAYNREDPNGNTPLWDLMEMRDRPWWAPEGQRAFWVSLTYFGSKANQGGYKGEPISPLLAYAIGCEARIAGAHLKIFGDSATIANDEACAEALRAMMIGYGREPVN